MKPQASLSLDLDNLWSYLKVHGDNGWQEYPSYLDHAVPKMLAALREHDLKITFFIVGADAARPDNRDALASIVHAGHEIGNHSFYHEPWIASASESDAYDELARAHEAISSACRREPVGFRGPGFACSPALLAGLSRMNYRYDASRLPTFIGPLARWYYFRSANFDAAQRQERRALFGAWHDGLAKNRAHREHTAYGPILRIPVTTMPGARVPIHFSYLHYLERFSPSLAQRYFRFALELCRLSGTSPSLLLHPLDFLGREDAPQLAFFPGMDTSGEQKIKSTSRYLRMLTDYFTVTPMEEHECA